MPDRSAAAPDPGRAALDTGAWRLLLGDGASGSGLRPDGSLAGPLRAASGARNMAVDQLLFEQVQNGAPPALRLYTWDPACLSLGRNQRARGRYDRPGVRCGVDIVRRPTGGLAVHHHDELTYAVVCPIGLLGSPRETYARINEALVAGLRALGVSARRAGAGGSPSPDDSSGVCFRTPAPGEVVAAGRKLVGSAQRCERRAILQHGSILIRGSQSAAQGTDPAAGPGRIGSAEPRAAGAITLAELMPEPPPAETIAAALVTSFNATLGTGLAPRGLTDDEKSQVRLHESDYRSQRWTWRR